ncbi:hypothetical protein [Roseomonas indoligenes]|uniref:DUF2225 domain-containing protein n=1 Tax=Roseomonas indoligenes TaxID=2820811 RepID=A0A940N370_9PROT|nr:hypothetical protein [Pararoseomonas indoligenes]MBP0494330.1 hypothetical protein [Pararoseomonas indoligenes]
MSRPTPGPPVGRNGPQPASRAGGSRSADVRCAVCGTESRQSRFRPVPPEGAPDLDLRPGEPLRGTMAAWLQQCPHCGYVAPEIARAHPAVIEAVGTAPFRALIADATHPPLSRRFLAYAYVLEETGALHAAAEATLQAAWAADDARKPELARAWRGEAVALWRAGPPLDTEQTVRVVDALRRSENFEDAGATAEQLAASHPPEAVAGVIALEQRLIALRDSGRHTVASALPPPARRPHATQSNIARRDGAGWWERLRRIFRRK